MVDNFAKKVNKLLWYPYILFWDRPRKDGLSHLQSGGGQVKNYGCIGGCCVWLHWQMLLIRALSSEPHSRYLILCRDLFLIGSVLPTKTPILLFCNSIALSILQRWRLKRNTALRTEFFQKRCRFIKTHSMIVNVIVWRMNQEIGTIV